MDNPLVSIIIPAYNAEKFIAEALDSVCTQTYRPLEIIVIDDGSKDKTADVVKNYQEINTQTFKQCDLFYYYQENGGPSCARNTGIQKTRGKYITFLDADDLWPKEKLQKQVDLMETHKNVVLLFGDVKRFSEAKGSADSMFVRRGITRELFGDHFYVKNAYQKLLIRNYIPTGTVIIRREYFKNGELFDENLRCVEDWDLWLRIAMNNAIAYSTNVWEFKRDHKSNISNNVENMARAEIEVLKKHNKLFHSYLKNQSINFRHYLGDSYLNLGIHYLKHSQFRKARVAFLKSTYYKIRLKPLCYWLTTLVNYH